MKKLIMLLPIFMLVGCSSMLKTHTVYKTKEVFIPVDTCTKSELPIIPELPIYTLTEEDKGDVDKIAKYYRSSIAICEVHLEILQNQLKVYK